MSLLPALAWVAAVAAFGLLQKWGRRLRLRERRVWWASNARDVINFAGLFALAAALWGAGFPLRVAVLIGGGLTVALALLERATARIRRHEWIVAAVGLLSGALLLPRVSEVTRAAEAFLASLLG